MKTPSKKIDERISGIRLFLLDLDGTIYRGDELVPGAAEFIGRLREKSIAYVFLTNNSSHSAIDYVAKLSRLSIPAKLENVFTSGQATGTYLSRKKPGGRVFVLGTRSLAHELASYGLVPSDGAGDVDFVVAGFDTELTYAKLQTACELVDRGVEFIATNPDLVCPVGGKRYLPDCGAICTMIEQATGKKPYAIGKPRTAMAELLCSKFSTPSAATAVIGDRLYTDIALGRNAGLLSICVLTGETKREDIELSPIKPDFTFSSIDELNWFFRTD
jgi:HAD superfamily hydrolase (TIGR01457 family)